MEELTEKKVFMSVTHAHTHVFSGHGMWMNCFEFQGTKQVPKSCGHHSVTLYLLVQSLFVLETNA